MPIPWSSIRYPIRHTHDNGAHNILNIMEQQQHDCVLSIVDITKYRRSTVIRSGCIDNTNW